MQSDSTDKAGKCDKDLSAHVAPRVVPRAVPNVGSDGAHFTVFIRLSRTSDPVPSIYIKGAGFRRSFNDSIIQW